MVIPSSLCKLDVVVWWWVRDWDSEMTVVVVKGEGRR